MPSAFIIANDRQARDASTVIRQIDYAFSSEQVLKSIVEGLPREVTEGVRRSLSAERDELADALGAYEEAKEGKSRRLAARVGKDPGALLIVARIARGWSQKELARRIFLPEQQIQRYEAERYRSISLGGLIRVGRALGVQVTADLSKSLNESWIPSYEMTSAEVQKILKHARNNGWLDKSVQSDENGLSQIKRAVAEHVGEYGTPSLLRTGLNVEDYTGDWLLLAWKAQVTRKAMVSIQRSLVKYRPLDVSWLNELVKLSSLNDGPLRVSQLLAEHGIILVTEPQIPGLKVDGAAFLVNDTPVIGLTLLRDSLDNFWFTLLHEIGHVILHYRTGLATGFFDDVEMKAVDAFEDEADQFAGNMLIPEELWARSPARIAKTVEPIERLAKQLSIAPAIIFGRIRMERKDYSLFSDKIGRGKVRALLLPKQNEVAHESFS
jgi:HTH-type transcriptional regulator/antitoxin HigA